MSKKFIDRDYLLHNLQNYHSFALFKDKQVEIVDIEESYNRVTDGAVDGAIEVTNDNIAVIQLFIEDISIGEYVEHIEKQTHFETVKETIYMPREDGYSKAEVDKLLDEVVAGDNPQQFTDEEAEELLDNLHSHEEYSDAEIEAMFENLTPEELEMYQNLINDNTTSTTRLWSSKKITEAISQAILDSNAYADGILGQCSSIELEYVQTLPDIGDSNKVYILESADITQTPYTLNFYNVNTSAWIEIGDFNINLDSYATTEYVDTKLADKANSSEVLAVDKVQTTTGSETNDTVYSSQLTKDELDKKINKTDIIDNLTSTDTDKPLSANQGKVLKDEVDLKANDSDVVKKTDIVTTIDSTSTDDKTPSAKAVYDNIKNKNTIQPSGTLANYSTIFDWAVNNVGASCGYEGNMFDDCPLNINDTWGTLVCIGTKAKNGLKVLFCTNFNKDIYIRTIQRIKGVNTWVTSWQRVCTTTVADVNETSIEFDETALELTIVTNRSSYKVINGICYVTIELNVVPPNDNKTYGYTPISKTRIPKIGFSTKATLNVAETNSSISAVLDKGDTIIKLHGNILAREGSCIIQGSFSYPVAES